MRLVYSNLNLQQTWSFSALSVEELLESQEAKRYFRNDSYNPKTSSQEILNAVQDDYNLSQSLVEYFAQEPKGNTSTN